MSRMIHQPFSRRAGFAASAATGTALLLQSDRAAFAQDATPVASPLPPATPDPQMQAVLDALAAFNAPPLETVTPFVGRNLPSFRNAVEAVLAERGEPAIEPVGMIEHVLFAGLDGEQVLARIYRPQADMTTMLPMLVYFHGGGFVIANLDTYDASCRALCNAVGAIVVAVAYRLAPVAQFPTAPNEAYAAVQFVLGGGISGGDTTKVAVVGESAGGNLATVSCLLARDQAGLMPVHQVLIYPVTTFAPTGAAAESVVQYADAKPLNAAMLQWFGEHYLADPADAASPYVSPLDTADLSGLPPATIVLAEIDPLQSQGAAYAAALQAAGGSATLHLYEGVTHEFFGMGLAVDTANTAVQTVASELKTAFGTM